MLIHIGYHKTGTTWLQKNFFPKHSDLFVPFQGIDLRKEFVHPNVLCFDAEAARQRLAPHIQEAEKRGKIAVLSSERLSGQPFSGGYDSAEIAKRLKKTFPNAKVWIVIRNQVDILTSCYATYVSVGGIANLDIFLNGQSSEFYPFFSLKHFEYHRLIRLYQNLFGRENVLISLYEVFRDNPVDFFAPFDKFMKINTDVSQFQTSRRSFKRRTDVNTLMTRYLNFFMPSRYVLRFPVIGSPRPLVGGLPLNRFVGKCLGLADRFVFHLFPCDIISNRVRNIVGDFYVDSNMKLEQLLGQPLRDKGYQLPAHEDGGLTEK